jgi:hypothetical protein
VSAVDDGELLEALRQALRLRRIVPPGFVQAGKGAFVWLNVDAELAQLTYDSSRGPAAVGMRAELASIRALTFTSAGARIELEITESSLLGQIVPVQAAVVEAHTGTAVAARVSSDEVGCFVIEPIPPGPFRLRCRTAAGADVLTGWILV